MSQDVFGSHRPTSKRRAGFRRPFRLQRLEQRSLLTALLTNASAILTVHDVEQNSTITTFAGSGAYGSSGDGGLATSAELSRPGGVAVDVAGDWFIADRLNNCVREVNAETGVITTIAGDGTFGFSGDGGQATAAELAVPQGVAVDANGDLFIADYGNNRIREVDLSSGIITTIAGGGGYDPNLTYAGGYGGDGGQATAAEIAQPRSVATDGSGHLFIADSANDVVREVALSTGMINTVAGSANGGHSGDGGAATAAQLGGVSTVAVDDNGHLFIAGDNAVREVDLSTGIITTVAGGGNADAYFVGPATAADLQGVDGLAVDADGHLFIGSNGVSVLPLDQIIQYGIPDASPAHLGTNLVREVDLSTGQISTLVGNGDGDAGYRGDGSAASAAALNDPVGLAVDANGDLFIADSLNNRIREVIAVDPPGTVIGEHPQSAPGLYNSATSVFYLRGSNTAGYADSSFTFGPAGSKWVPFTGKWTKSEYEGTVGLYDPSTSTFYLPDSNASETANTVFQFGPAGSNWVPLAGDWTGSGTTSVGLYNPATSVFYLRNSNSAGVADTAFQFGPAGSNWIPLAGDWNGDGTTTVGLYDPTASVFFLRYSNAAGYADNSVVYGPAGRNWTPVAGDWTASGITTVGLYDPSTAVFYLRNSNTAGYADTAFAYGPPGGGWTPIIWAAGSPVGAIALSGPSIPSLVHGTLASAAGSLTVTGNSATTTAAPASSLNPQAVDFLDLSSLATNQSLTPITGLEDTDLSAGIATAIATTVK